MEYLGKVYLPVPGFDGYFVSRDGVVLTTRRRVKPAWRKPQLGTSGYLELSVRVGTGQEFRVGIHRLVALTYLPIPDGVDPSMLVVNHINGRKHDNAVENLEWVSHQRNAEHAGATGLTSKCRPVVTVRDADRKETKHPSIVSCARYLGLSRDAVNWRVRSRGMHVFEDGLRYMFEEDLERCKNLGADISIQPKNAARKVLMRNLNDGSVAEYKSQLQLSVYLRRGIGTISRWLREENQPVLPGFIQLKFADDPTPWREVLDAPAELSAFTKTRIVTTIDTHGVVEIYPSAAACCRARNISPTCLDYRLNSNGNTLYDGFYYKYYTSTDSPVGSK